MKKRLTPDFYELNVKQLMDKRVWDLPLIEEDDSIHRVLNILGARNHIWVVKDKKEKELVGIITEHDVLSILAPKSFPSYVFGMPDIKSILKKVCTLKKPILKELMKKCRWCHKSNVFFDDEFVCVDCEDQKIRNQLNIYCISTTCNRIYHTMDR